MSEVKKKCRQYSIEYLNFGFTTSPSNSQLSMCLLCNRVLSNKAMKPSRLKDHLVQIHPDKANKDRQFFVDLKNKQVKGSITNVFDKKDNENKKGQLASYNLSHLFAKCGHPFTSGEKLVLPAIKEVISTVLNRDPTSVIQSIALSNDSVARRINEMGGNVENQTCDILKTSTFSLQLDETSPLMATLY